jgi:hypothetical protein
VPLSLDAKPKLSRCSSLLPFLLLNLFRKLTLTLHANCHFQEQNGQTSHWVLHDAGWSCAALGKENFIAQIMYRQAFEVMLPKGVTVREKPSLKGKVIGLLKPKDVVIKREVKAHKEKSGEVATWIRHHMGW